MTKFKILAALVLLLSCSGCALLLHTFAGTNDLEDASYHPSSTNSVSR